jgi:peptidylprolyl isomerase
VADEPLPGFRRVEIQNLLQDYGDRIPNQKIESEVPMIVRRSAPEGHALRYHRRRAGRHLVAWAIIGLAGGAGAPESAFAQNPPPAVPQRAVKPKAPVAAPAPVAAAQPAAPAPHAAEATASGGEPVARVGGRDVSASEIRSLLAGVAPDQRAALARDPALLNQTLRAMFARQLVLKEAADKKWQDQPAVVAQLAKLREEAIVETYLQSMSRRPRIIRTRRRSRRPMRPTRAS